MGLETELKLLATPEGLRKVAALPEVRALKASPARNTQLVSRYFDTPNEDLRNARMALRLRRSGNRWLQAVKSAGSSTGGLASRGEWEEAVPGPELSLHLLKSTPAYKAIGGEEGFKSLRPLFETDFRRTLIPLHFSDGSKAELCFDLGAVKAGGRAAPICEIELELKEGSPARLFDLASQLAAAIPLRIASTSKAERGHALAARRSASPVKAVPARLDKGMTADQALRAIASACLEQLLRNDAGVLAGRDPEYIHQARVALRRMRSIFSLMGDQVTVALPPEVSDLISAAARALGAARDWDVLHLELLRPLAAAFPGDAGMQALVRRAARSRTARGRAAREFVTAPAYMQGLLGLGRFLAVPEVRIAEGEQTKPNLPALAAQLLQRRHRRVRKQAMGLELAALSVPGPARASVDYEQLHSLRIQAKKLRYAAEFFQPLFAAKRSHGYVRALSQLQDALGGLNDCATGECLLADLRKEMDAGAANRNATRDAAARATELALARAQGWLAANRERHFAAIPDAWEAFVGETRFWKKDLPKPKDPPKGAPEKKQGLRASEPVEPRK